MLKPAVVCFFVMTTISFAKDEPGPPKELASLRTWVGIWDAEIEVWPQGLDKPSIKFEGVETNRAYDKYWIASDFDSTFNGQLTRVHSIVGYDLDQRKLVGKVIDDGPYAASMVGDYDEESRTVTWRTDVKDADGKPIVQRTTVTELNDNERLLVLSVPTQSKNVFKKFMQIRFNRRKAQ